jgi:hypothetical protein
MNAAEARLNTEVRGRVALAVRTSSRAISDLLNGYEGQPTLAAKIRAALDREGVDVATIPKRTPAEVAAWKERRQPKCKACAEKEAALEEALKLAMPEGFEVEQCACGRMYPRMVSEAEGGCPKCWRKDRDANRSGWGESRAEIEGMQQVAAERPARRTSK